jgi:hypothetical protein
MMLMWSHSHLSLTLEIWRTVLKSQKTFFIFGYLLIVFLLLNQLTKLGFTSALKESRKANQWRFPSEIWATKVDYLKMDWDQCTDQALTWNGNVYMVQFHTKLINKQTCSTSHGHMSSIAFGTKARKFTLHIHTHMDMANHSSKLRSWWTNLNKVMTFISIEKFYFILLKEEKWNYWRYQALKT